MRSQDPEDVARRLGLALDLCDLGVELLRTRLRREDPAISDAEVERRVRAWLRERPGAEQGDGDGRPVAWPRGAP